MPAWIEAANPLLPWRAAQVAGLPAAGPISEADLSWRPLDDDWFVISSSTGGWAVLADSERAELTSMIGRRSGEITSPLLIDAWRRGLVEISGRSVVSGIDWAEAIDSTREHYGLVVVLNAGCNLACTYCYLGHGAPARSNDVERSLAESAILVALNRPEDLVIVDFGEFAAATSLFYDLATFTVAQARSRSKRLRIAVQTNATTLNDHMIEFLAENDAILGISIDGPAPMHDLARPLRSGRGSHDAVSDALRRCRAAGLDYHLIVTVGAHNVADPDAVIAEIESHRPRTFLCKPILAKGEAESAWRDVGASDDAIASFLARSIDRAAATGLHMLDQSAAKFLLRMVGDAAGWRESCTSRNCSSGRNLHVLSARGELHACPRFVEPGQGTIVDPDSLTRYLSGGKPLLDSGLRAAPVTCSGCPWLRSCGGGCTLSGQAGHGGAIPLPDRHCASYISQHEALADSLLPALLSGAVALDGPLAGATVRIGASAI